MEGANCVFCQIASGAIPSLRVLETADSVAFLDVRPLAPGHLLLIPKTHYESLLDVPAGVLGELTSQLPALARAVREATGATGLNLLQNNGASSGQVVFHLHFHLIPRRQDDGLGYRWNAGKYQDGEAESLQSRIIGAIGKRG